MHRLALLLLAVLLPLRLLGAQAWALQMGLPGPQAAPPAAAHAMHHTEPAAEHAHAMPADCPMAHAGGADGTPAQSECQTCPLCFAWALPAPLPLLAGTSPPPGRAAAPPTRFASVLRAPEHKPPIG